MSPTTKSTGCHGTTRHYSLGKEVSYNLASKPVALHLLCSVRPVSHDKRKPAGAGLYGQVPKALVR